VLQLSLFYGVPGKLILSLLLRLEKKIWNLKSKEMIAKNNIKKTVTK